MKAKLLALLAWLKGSLSAMSPSALLVGLAAGYFGHGLIKLAIDAALGLAKLLLKL